MRPSLRWITKRKIALPIIILAVIAGGSASAMTLTRSNGASAAAANAREYKLGQAVGHVIVAALGDQWMCNDVPGELFDSSWVAGCTNGAKDRTVTPIDLSSVSYQSGYSHGSTETLEPALGSLSVECVVDGVRVQENRDWLGGCFEATGQ